MKLTKKILAGTLALCSVFTLGVIASDNVYDITAKLSGDIKVYVDKELQTFQDANGETVYPIIYNGTTYLPVRAIGGLMGKEVHWDNDTRSISLGEKFEETTETPETPEVTEYNRMNPAPIGVSQTVGAKILLNEYNARVTVNSVVRGEEAWDMIYNENEYAPKPKDGKEYILANVTMEILDSTEEDTIYFNHLAFSIFSTDYVAQNGTIMTTSSIPSPAFGGNVYAGGKLEGYVPIMVDITDENPKLTFGITNTNPDGIWFDLGK